MKDIFLGTTILIQGQENKQVEKNKESRAKPLEQRCLSDGSGNITDHGKTTGRLISDKEAVLFIWEVRNSTLDHTTKLIPNG